MASAYLSISTVLCDTECFWSLPISKGWGYTHDGRADKDPYPHDRRADKDSYPHDRMWLTIRVA